MSDKHTLGPWQPDDHPNGRYYGVSAYREGFKGAPIVVWRGIARPGSAEGKANARLIAAAPAMLEALRSAAAFIGEEADNREYAGSEHSDYEREPRDLVNRINAAIALATG